jgi:EAL domain-containing protein (putative c-di-GMP-specific phosphodiesterase class I)
MGKALGMTIIAEGVETKEQQTFLRDHACDEMQGFLFAKACPAEAIDKILARPAARATAKRSDRPAS